MLVLFADTDMDISKKKADGLGIRLISMPYTVDDTTVHPYEDYDEFDSHAFYDTLRNGKLPTTFAISEEKYEEYFRPCFAAGDDILYVHFSAAMTATFDNMRKAVDRLLEQYPERKFHEIDTKGITAICYPILLEIAALWKDGKSAEEIIEWSKTGVDSWAMYFFADDLRFFRRSGRVSGLAATMGGLIGIRPVIYMSSEGKMESVGKEKGRAKAMDRLLSYVEELGDDVKGHKVIIGHTDAPEIAEEMEEMLKEKYGADLDTEIVPTNPTAGSHCGPNGVGVAFHAKHR